MDDQVLEITETLREARFPFSVCINKIINEEMKILQESDIHSLVYEYDEIEEKISATRKYDYWRQDLEFFGTYYFWYEVEGEEIYNSDIYDSIIKGN